MSGNDKIRSTFYDEFPYAVLYVSWDGLRIERCKTKEHMEQVFVNIKSCYLYVQKVEVKTIE